MVAIFTGIGLGTFNTSVTQLGQSGGGRLGQSRETQGVNVATGNLVLQALDESLVNRGLAAAALRTYNSRGQVSGMGQDGWVTGYERWVELVSGEFNAAGSVARLHTGDGEAVDFVFDTTRGYTSTRGDGAHDFMEWDDGWNLLEGSSQRWESYSNNDSNPYSPALLRSFYQNNTAYIVNYDAHGRISEVASSVGYPNGDAILYNYDEKSQRLASISTRETGVVNGVVTTIVREQVSYGYDSVGRLAWVQTDLTPDETGDAWSADASQNDGRFFRTSYTYVSGDAADLRIASVTASDGTTVSYTYSADDAGGWRIKTVTEGSAEDGSARALKFVYGIGTTDVIDAAGRTWTYCYDANKQLTAVLAPAVDGMRQMTSYDYDVDGNVTRIATSQFNAEEGEAYASVSELRYRYDTHGNRIQQRDLLGNVVAWTYNQANQVTSETRYTVADVDGLDADEAGNWSSPSGALITRYVYEADWSDRLRFVINAAGEVRELTYTWTAPNYDGMLSSERQYLGERYAGTTYTLQALTAWATDLAAQRRVNSSLTSYTYDVKGRLQQRIDYATVAANVAGDGVLDSAATITRYIHDAQGLLRQSIVSHGVGRTATSTLAGSEITEYTYDGMGRLLSTLKRDVSTAADNDARTVSTTYSYVDSSNRITVTQDAGLMRIETRNRAGELRAISQSALGATPSPAQISHRYYDNTGLLRASEDAAGGRTYYFYDGAGRQVATVDATGAVTRVEYDQAGRVTTTTRYANAINTQGWLDGGEVTKQQLVYAPTAPLMAVDQAWVQLDGSDRVAQLHYDVAGHLVRTSDNAGSETTYEYDGVGRLVRTTQLGDYIYVLGGDTMVTMKMAIRPRPMPVREMRTTRMFYDAAGRLVATLDAEGYLSESMYDAGGRLVKTVRYATRTNAANATSGSLDQLRPVSIIADQTTRYFYDARGRQIGLLDAEGYLTESIYDEQNNQRATREYAKKLTALSGAATFLELRAAALGNDAPIEAIRETRNTYNGLGQQVISRSNVLDRQGVSLTPAGTITRYSYDEAGRLVKTEAAADSSEVRANGQRYDVFGNLIGELNGTGAALLRTDLTETELDVLYAGYGVRHSYDALGRRIETIDQLGHKTWTIHDTARNRKFVVRGVEDDAGLKNARGEVSEVRYTAFGEVADTLSYEGRITLAQPGDRASAVSALGQLTALEARSNYNHFDYDLAGRLQRQVDIGGLETYFNYNRFGDLTQTIRLTTEGAWLSQQDYSYDRRGLRVNSYEYADRAQERLTQKSYDAFGRVIRAVDGRGTVSEFSYDRLGRSVSQTLRNVSGQDLTTLTSYDAFDRVITQTDAMNRVTQYSHSDAARSMTVVTPEGVTVTTVHNAFGQTIETRQPLPDGTVARQQVAYDNRGLQISATDALGHVATQQYDARGQLLRTTDATGRSVAYAYDAAGRTLRRIEDPDGLQLTTRYAYDAEGRQLQVTDASGRVSRMTYDRKGQLIELAQDPNGLNLRTSYTWDVQGRQLSVIEGAGTAAARITAYEYDGFGRRISETIGTGSAQVVTNYEYDTNGNMVRKSGAGGPVVYAYDAANRLRFTLDAVGGLTEQVFDRDGRVTAHRSYAKPVSVSSLLGMDVPGEAQLAALVTTEALRDDARDVTAYQVYDGDGRVRLSIDGGGGVVENIYDSAGRAVAQRKYANRVALTPSVRGGLEQGTALVGDLTPAVDPSDDIQRTFYDNAGRAIYKLNAAGGITKIDYDAAGRIAQVRVYEEPYGHFGVSLAYLATASVANLDSFVQGTDGNAQSKVSVYDGAGRLCFEVSGNGAVRETRYNAAGDVYARLSYLGTLSQTQLSGLSAAFQDGTATVAQVGALVALNNNVASVPLDQTAASEYVVCDSAGRSRFSVRRVDASKVAVVERQYDAANHVIAVFSYTNVIATTPTLEAKLANGTVSAADINALSLDRTTAQMQRMTYDSAGRLVFSIDGAGSVVGMHYNAAGLVSETRRYAQSLPPAILNTAPDTATVAAALIETAQDHVEYNVYDASARLVFKVRGDAFVEEIRYDGIGRVQCRLSYSARLADAIMTQVATASAGLDDFSAYVIANQTGARAEALYYDQAGRVRYRVLRVDSAHGQVSESRFDGIGREVEKTAYGVFINYTLGAIDSDVAAAISSALSTNSSVRSAQINTQRTFYDGTGNQRYIVDASGVVTAYVFDGIGHLRATIAYGVRPPAMATADAASLETWTQIQLQGSYRITSLDYDVVGQVVTRTDAHNFSEKYTYDAVGNITSKTDRRSSVWRYEYDRAGRRVTEITPNVMVYDTAISQDVDRPIVLRLEYDGVGNVIKRIEDADGSTARTTRYEYDNRGHQVRTVLPDPITGADAVVGANDTIEIRYDIFGQAVSEKDALGNYRYKVYDASGRVVYDVDQELQVTSYRYNAFGEEIRSVRHENRVDTSVMAFAAAGWQAGKPLSEALISAGLVLSVRDRGIDSRYIMLGQKDLVQQDAVSYVKSDGTVSMGRPTLQSTYNAYGEVVKESVLIEGTLGQAGAVWAETWHYYDAMGRQTVSVDAEGYVNEQTYTEYGEVKTKTEYARKLSGSVLAGMTTDAPPVMPVAGDAWTGYDRKQTFEYDLLGRVVRQTAVRYFQSSSDGAIQSADVFANFIYDAEGNVNYTQTAQGWSNSFYDRLGRKTSFEDITRSGVDFLDANQKLLGDVRVDLTSASLYKQYKPILRMSYDAFGNTSFIGKQYSYIENNTMWVKEDPGTAFIHDRRGRVVRERYVGGGVLFGGDAYVDKKYDAADRLVETRGEHQWYDHQKASDYVSTVTYDKAGRVVTTIKARDLYGITTMGGVRTPLGTVIDSTDIVRYNAFGEIVGKDDRLVDAFNTAYGAHNFAEYQFDNAGRMTRTNAENGAWQEQGYDLAGRVVRIAKKSFTVNALNVQQVVDAVTYATYDKLGRVIRQELPSNSDDLSVHPVVRREYDRWGNVIRTVDARGFETLYQYNDQNKVVLEVKPEVKVVNRDGTEVRLRPTVAAFYDENGLLTETVDANKNKQKYEYDNVGRMIKKIDANGASTLIRYDRWNQEVFTQNAVGYITYKAHDYAGRVQFHGDYVTKENDAGKRQSSGESYGLGFHGERFSSQDTAGLFINYKYDSRNLVLSSWGNNSPQSSYAYDLQGRKIRQSNGGYLPLYRGVLNNNFYWGVLTGGVYSAYALESNVQFPLASGAKTIDARVDRDGELVLLNEQTWDYDYFGRLVDHNDLGGADYDYTYQSQTGQLVRTTRADSQTVSFLTSAQIAQAAYGNTPVTNPNTVDRELHAMHSSSFNLSAPVAANERIQFYYASGLLKEIREGNGWTRYAYDASGNKTLEETYTKDISGKIVWLRTLTTYDSQGRVSSVRQIDLAPSPDVAGVDGTADVMSVYYGYDAVGNRRRVTTGILPEPNSGEQILLYGHADRFLERDAQPAITSVLSKRYPGISWNDATYRVTATLADGSPLPSWMGFDRTTMRFTGKPPSPQQIDLLITVTNVDDQSVETCTVHYAVGTSGPALTTGPVTRVTSVSENLFEFEANTLFYDPNDQHLTYTATGLPQGMSIHAVSGKISGMPLMAGNYSIIVTATDTDGQIASCEVYLNVQSWGVTLPTDADYSVDVTYPFWGGVGAAPTSISIVSGNLGDLYLQQDYPGHWKINGAAPYWYGDRDVVIKAIYADGTIRLKTLTLHFERADGDPYLYAGIAPDLGGVPSAARRPVTASGNTSIDVSGAIDNSNAIVDPIDDPGDGDNPPHSTPRVRPGSTYLDIHNTGWKSLWYEYDNENRVIVANAVLVGGQISLGALSGETDISYRATYDLAGHEIRRLYLKNGQLTIDNTVYNERGQRIATYAPIVSGSTQPATIAEKFKYDAAGRLQERLQYIPGTNTVKRRESYVYSLNGQVSSSSTAVLYQGAMVEVSSVFYIYDWVSTNTLYEMQLTVLKNEDGSPMIENYYGTREITYVNHFRYGYFAGDSYLERSITGWSSYRDIHPASTSSSYDQWGRRTGVNEGGANTVFAYNADGNIIEKHGYSSLDQPMRYLFANGQQIAATKADYADVVTGLTGYSNSDSGVGTATVLPGDTLRTISQRIYGTSNLWYLLASANSIDDSRPLVAGTLIKVPDVKVATNDVDTHKPYNPNDAVGNTMPTLNYVASPPPSGNSCYQAVDIIFKVIMAIAVVAAVAVVTAATAGALAGPGASVGMTMLAGAAGGAAGAIVGQGLSLGLGLTSKFDWSSVATSAVVSAVTAGFGKVLDSLANGAKEAESAMQLAKAAGTSIDGMKQATVLQSAARAICNSTWARGAVEAVVSNVANYGANWAMNRIDSSRERSNEKFSWAGLAGSAVSGAVTGKLSNWMGKSVLDESSGQWVSGQSGLRQIANDVVTGFVGSAISHNVTTFFGGDIGSPDYGQMATDSFGHALGNAANRAITNIKENEINKKREAERYEQIFHDAQLLFDPNEDVFGNVRTQGEENQNAVDSSEFAFDLASSEENYIFVRDDKYAEMDNAFFQKQDDLRQKIEWLKGIVGRYDAKSGYEAASPVYGLDQQVESTQVRQFLEKQGFLASAGSDENFLGKAEIVMAKLCIIDPALSNHLYEISTNAFEGNMLSVAKMQEAIGFGAKEINGFFDEKTRNELSKYLRSPIQNMQKVADGKFTYPKELITEEQFVNGLGAGLNKKALNGLRERAKEWVPLLNEAMYRNGINTPNSIAAFVANAAEETGLFVQAKNEIFSYKQEKALEIFKVLKNHPEKVSDFWYDGNKLIRKRDWESFANLVYGPEKGDGLGNFQLGDGYRFRGRGIFQLTGRSNYTRVGNALGYDFANNPDLVNNHFVGSMAAAYYFKDAGLVNLADKGKFSRLVKVINSNKQNYDTRLNYYNGLLNSMRPVLPKDGQNNWQAAPPGLRAVIPRRG